MLADEGVCKRKIRLNFNDITMSKYLTILLIACILNVGGASLSFAADKEISIADLKVEVVVSAETGWPTRLIVSGSNPRAVAWLGVSFYPYGVADAITGGRHSVIELKKGDIRQEISIDPALLGGSFEFALWGSKVSKVECHRDYCYWCKVNGFHLDESLAYASGLLTQLTGYK